MVGGKDTVFFFRECFETKNPLKRPAVDELRACGSVKEARARGKVRMEGKGYEVQDGDIITFHFSR